MRASRRRREGSRTSGVVLAVVGIAMSGYFAYHAMTGRHGLEARARLLERRQLLGAEIEGLRRERDHLKSEVAAIAPDVPHPDLVDEVARDVLGFGRPGEIVVLRRAR